MLALCSMIVMTATGAKAQFTSRVTEHTNTSRSIARNDSDHALYVSDGTNLYLSDGVVTKTSASGQNVLFSRTYMLDAINVLAW